MAGEANTLAVPKDREKTFERGFKTWCENTAESIRKRMDLQPSDPLSPVELAAHLGVILLDLDKVPGIDQAIVSYLSSAEGDEWSALTVHANGKQIIIVNPRHSQARQASNIMHELAHILRGHKPAQVFMHGAFALRDFDQMQEAEANWFAGCLLLPRAALLSSGYRNESVDDAIARFGVSRSLFVYRTNISGVGRQLRAINHY